MIGEIDGVTTTSEFEEQMSEKKLPELSFIINEENEKFAEIIASPLPKGMGEIGRAHV